MHERLGQLRSDVAGADDDRGPSVRVAKGVLELERVVHRVKHVHTRHVEAVQRRPDRLGPGRDDETVITQLARVAHRRSRVHGPRERVDTDRLVL